MQVKCTCILNLMFFFSIPPLLFLSENTQKQCVRTLLSKAPSFPKEHRIFEGSHTSTVCPSYRSSIKMQMGMEQWWNDTAVGKLTHLEINLSQ